MILCGNPLLQYISHKTEIDEAISRVLEKGWYILGEEVKAFEEEFAQYIGVSYGVGVSSGTEALHLALVACGIGSSDEVITVSHTAVATVAAIELAGATPALVDIEPDFYTLDPCRLEEAITAKTKAIIAVHLYGHPADLEPILWIARKYGVWVIEDCAQAHGATYRGRRVGSWGDMACFSFYPTKNLGALGDGGMVVTNDATLAKEARLLRQYGWTECHVSHKAGWNTRLSEIQAAVLRTQLKYLDKDNKTRCKLAKVYEAGLSQTKLILPMCRRESSHVYHLYVVRLRRRDELQAYLKRRDVSALVHYPVPVHLQPAYRGRLPGADSLPETERAAREVLSLPMYPRLDESEVQTVIEAVLNFQGEQYD